MTTKITPGQARELARTFGDLDVAYSALHSLADQIDEMTAERDSALKLAADRMVDAEQLRFKAAS